MSSVLNTTRIENKSVTLRGKRTRACFGARGKVRRDGFEGCFCAGPYIYVVLQLSISTSMSVNFDIRLSFLGWGGLSVPLALGMRKKAAGDHN